MDNQEKNPARAQTTKVAEEGMALDGKTSDTMSTVRKDASTNAASSHQDSSSPKIDRPHLSPSLKAQSSPSSRSPEQPKRRASRSPSADHKRQRTSLSSSTARQPPSTARSSPPTRVRPDEKARSRRLFGGMLSTIAAKPNQRSTRPEPRKVDSAKREEFEKRAAERERIRLKEEEDARREREAKRREEKKEKYIRWERDTILARAGNERLKADFLKTEARPELFYKPYILTKDQRATIERQIDETEAQNDQDIRKYEDAHPDQPPLPWKRLPAKLHKDIDMDGQARDDTPQVSAPAPPRDAPPREEPVSRMDGVDEREQTRDLEMERPRNDEFDEDVIETSEGGVSLIY